MSKCSDQLTLPNKNTTQHGPPAQMETKPTYAELEQRVKELEQDFRRRERLEEELLAARQQFEDIIQSLPDPTFVIDRDRKIVAWNRAIEEMTNIKAEDILGKSNYEYSLAFYEKRKPVLIDLVFSRDEMNREEYIHFKEEKDMLIAETHHNTGIFHGVYLWSLARPLYDVKGNVVGAIESIRDITESKRTQNLFLTLPIPSPAS